MSLSNPNKPVTEQRLHEFYNKIKAYLGFTEMPSEDIAEVASPLPSVGVKRMKYSTEEQVIGEWVDGKTLYQKSYVLPKSFLLGTSEGASFDLDISKTTCNVVKFDCFFYRTDMFTTYAMNTNNFPNDSWSSFINLNKGGSTYYRAWIKLGSEYLTNNNIDDSVLTIQYTKTTD